MPVKLIPEGAIGEIYEALSTPDRKLIRLINLDDVERLKQRWFSRAPGTFKIEGGDHATRFL